MSNTTSRLSPDCLSGGVYITEDLRKSYPSREAAADRGFSSYGSGKFSQSLHGNAWAFPGE
ncbi:hypothetical protein P8818_03720 [Bacillus velezensis]|uniref:hypothetical protein n=1 Tax=Bacillus TaxID=1386 RepID=UPI0003979E78|nr:MULTISPECIES: hypothetical protein [Bacillus]ERH59399.1 hypothetical protein O205_03940 [Bacillus amyloliquefaciens EGD-AQ14]KAF6538825.1 hypothetical protein G9F75_07995 [Bacillus sp. EKM208B]MCY0088751.1 hypothetical protein [Bacillus velezensis]MDL0427927.1 hypothetical protein [Bacillus amyloliquefaciens]MEC0386704.1 hypothetical protein [Bacillus velezensis]